MYFLVQCVIKLFASLAVRWCQLQKNTIHYKTLHKDKFGVLEGRLRENKLKNVKCDLQRQQNILTVVTKTNEAAVQTSFIISQILKSNSFLKISVFLQIWWLNV
jgi:S-adenosylmethionine hydrolase